MDEPSKGSNSDAVHAWLKTLPGTTREQYLSGQDIALANLSQAGVGSDDWHHWVTVLNAIGEFMRLDRRPFIGDLLESAPAVAIAVAA